MSQRGDKTSQFQSLDALTSPDQGVAFENLPADLVSSKTSTSHTSSNDLLCCKGQAPRNFHISHRSSRESNSCVSGLSDSIMQASSRVATISKPHGIRSTAVTCDSVMPQFQVINDHPGRTRQPRLEHHACCQQTRSDSADEYVICECLEHLCVSVSAEQQLPSQKPSARAQPRGSAQVQPL